MADYFYDSCSLPDPDVGPTVLVRDGEHTSFHVGLCGRKFVLCLFDQSSGLCTICHSWQHPGVVHLSLQADDNVAFEEIQVFGVCRPAGNDSSMYLFILVLFLDAVAVPRVYVAFNIFYQHIFQVYLGLLSITITFFYAIFIFYPIGYFYRIVLVASVVIPAVFFCTRMCHQQTGHC